MSQPGAGQSPEQPGFANYGTTRRFTTITLRELQFYGHCDCCPDPRFPNRKHQTQARDPIGPSQYIYHARPTLVPRTDSEESVDSQDSPESRTQSTTSIPGTSGTSQINNYSPSSSSNQSSVTSTAVSATAMPVRTARTTSNATTSTISTINSRSSTASPLGWLRRKGTTNA